MISKILFSRKSKKKYFKKVSAEIFTQCNGIVNISLLQSRCGKPAFMATPVE